MGDEGLGSTLQELVRKGNLHQHQADQLLGRSLKGEHVFILGPHKSGKIKLARALSHEIGKIARVWSVDNVASRDGIASGLKDARSAGADYVLVMHILPAELFWLLKQDSTVCIIASVAATNAATFWLCAGEDVNERQNMFEQCIYQVGFDSHGNAQLDDGVSDVKVEAKTLDSAAITEVALAFPQNWTKDTVEHDPGWELDLAIGEKI